MGVEQAILIAKAVVTMVDALGMKAENENRLANGLSQAYTDNQFFELANELRKEIEELNKE